MKLYKLLKYNQLIRYRDTTYYANILNNIKKI